MKPAPPLPEEEGRLCALIDLNILDTPSEEEFDRITRLAKDLFHVPIALVSLVDSDRQWFKSKQGLEATETPRDISFCGHAIAQGSIFLVEDALSDDRFRDNPLVEGEPHIRFYAGYPLQAPTGHKIGTLCVIDREPRHFDAEQCQQLRDLGALIESELRKRPGSEPHSPLSGLRRARWLRTVVNWLSSRAGAMSISIIFTLFAAAMYAGWDLVQLNAYKSEIRNRTIEQLAYQRSRLETSLNSKLYLVNGLTGFARSGYKIRESSFQAFAAELASNTNSIRSLQLAPGGVVTHVWPREENRSAIGHDLLADLERRKLAELAIQSRGMWIAGPLNLIQGGVALIGRQPIYLKSQETPGEESFWGFATILLDLPQLLDESGLSTEDSNYEYALRGKNSQGNEGEVFFGKAALFERNSVKGDIALPAGSWQLAVMPRGGWPMHWPGQEKYRIGAIALICLLGSLVFYLLRLPYNTRLAIQKATSALEKSEHRFRDAIESMSEGIAIYNAQDQLVIHNERFRKIYDRTSPYIEIGRQYRDVLSDAFRHGQFSESLSGDTAEEHFANALQNHTTSESSIEQQLWDGRWVRVKERKMRDGGTVTLHSDITDQKENENALVSAREKAELSNEAKTTFLATVSHEVRTPLNGVLGLLTVLNDDQSLEEQQKKYVQTAHQSAKQLLNILNEILDISKMEAGKLDLELIPFNLKETILGAVDLVRTQAELKSLALNINIDSALDNPLLGDEGRIRQVLLNLLSNAVKFTDEGSVSISAETLSQNDKFLKTRIQVIDTGIGFESEKAEQLFEPFSQLDSNSTRKISGTGLGLAICKRLIESMGGEISANSLPDQGATFTIDLELPRSERQETKEQVESKLPVDLGWDTVRVLLAEDSATNQMVIQAMLANTGYQVDTANNGIEAVDALRNLEYDIVLMDIFMPEMDGLQATHEIRKQYSQDQVPIIALTANAMEGDKEKFMQAGMDDFLSKPVDKAELLGALFRWSPQSRSN